MARAEWSLMVLTNLNTSHYLRLKFYFWSPLLLPGLPLPHSDWSSFVLFVFSLWKWLSTSSLSPVRNPYGPTYNFPGIHILSRSAFTLAVTFLGKTLTHFSSNTTLSPPLQPSSEMPHWKPLWTPSSDHHFLFYLCHCPLPGDTL